MLKVFLSICLFPMSQWLRSKFEEFLNTFQSEEVVENVYFRNVAILVILRKLFLVFFLSLNLKIYYEIGSIGLQLQQGHLFFNLFTLGSASSFEPNHADEFMQRNIWWEYIDRVVSIVAEGRSGLVWFRQEVIYLGICNLNWIRYFYLPKLQTDKSVAFSITVQVVVC